MARFKFKCHYQVFNYGQMMESDFEEGEIIV